jgi:hypothetical protein
MTIKEFLIVEAGFITMNLKNWIKEHLLTSSGKINTRKIMKNGQWIKENHPDIFNQLNESASFVKYNSFSELLYIIMNDITSPVTCTVCNNPVLFSTFQSGYKMFCSTGCVSHSDTVKEKRNRTNLKRYGVDNVAKLNKTQEKRKDTTVEKYGVEHGFQSDGIKEKIKNTNLNNYGVENVSQAQSIKEKKQESILNRYGVDNISQIDWVQDKIKKTMIKNHGVSHWTQSPENKEKMREVFLDRYGTKTFKESFIKNYNLYNKDYIEKTFITEGILNFTDLIEFFNISRCCAYKMLKDNNIDYRTEKSFISLQETEIANFLTAHGISVNRNDRTIIHPQEIDIYAPLHKIGIEFNGLYWHSEANGKDKNYHLMKTTLCKAKGIQLIHVFEDEWAFKENIVKSILLSKFNIYKEKYHARKCHVKEIDNKTKSLFLKENHLQGDDNSSVRLGLFHGNVLLSVMTFGRRKITGGESKFELLRFCNKLNVQTMGGASKLFSYFIKNFDYDKITTYADVRYGDGKLYERLGFSFKHQSQPNYWYFKNGVRFNRMTFQKHKLKNLLERFDDTVSEKINLINNSYNTIFDCGNFVFEFTKKET